MSFQENHIPNLKPSWVLQIHHLCEYYCHHIGVVLILLLFGISFIAFFWNDQTYVFGICFVQQISRLQLKKGFNTRHVNIYKTMFLHWLLFPWFSRDAHSTLPIKRLWFHLIKQEPLKEVFIRYIFRKKVNQSEVSAHSTNQQERKYFWMRTDSFIKVVWLSNLGLYWSELNDCLW